MSIGEMLKGSIWAWCEKVGNVPGGYIELRADGIASAWGLSFWSVTNESTREITVDDIGGAGKHVLYFNSTLTAFVCSHSGQRGFDPYKFRSPSEADVPTSWPVQDVWNPVEGLKTLDTIVSNLFDGGSNMKFGSTVIDFEGLNTLRGLVVPHGPIAYAKGSEIIKMKVSDGPAPCRQVLEAQNPNFFHLARDVLECFQGNNVISISYAWAVRGGGHPDPSGFHLKRIQQILRSYMVVDGRDPAVFLDWFSLYQLHCDEMPRTAHQTQMFDVGLRLMHVNYGHKGARVALLTDLPDGKGLTPYMERGWPWFERSCAAVGANWVLSVRMSDAEVAGLAKRPRGDGSLLTRFRQRREPPLLPDAFAAELARKTMTVAADIDLVRQLYSECFSTIAGSARKLALCNIGADDAWVRRLCQALPAYRNLQCIDLSGPVNQVRDDALRALAGCLVHLPRLRLLYLIDAHVSPRCLEEVRPAFEGRELLLGRSR